ncbi:MAG: hypothetical protein KAG84_05250 [Bacteroidales bacterium]|nr:hypothetical protein [Bacteroidales bacterium]
METVSFNNTLTIITKEETVKTLNHNIIPNTCVLEVANPFPGYYSTSFITSESKPETLFIVLNEKVSLDFFYRRLYSINKNAKYDFSAALADLEFNNKKYYAIRIFDLDTYDNIVDLENLFIEAGFNLSKSVKIDAEVLIHIHKFCNLNLTDEVYYSADNSHFVYFGVGKEISWNAFEIVTKKIRHNYIGNKFDAGLGIIFHHNKVEDVVRIYGTDLSKDDLNKLMSMYQKEI